MRLEFTLAGVSPLVMHNGAAGLDTRSSLHRELATIPAKRGGNRTEVDDKRLRQLECQRSLYLGDDGKPTLPEAALRAVIEAGARKTKQGPLVREGLMIESVAFGYDVKRYGEDLEKLRTTAQFVVPVVVSRQRILRTRAKFDCPWSVAGIADVKSSPAQVTELREKIEQLVEVIPPERLLVSTSCGVGRVPHDEAIRLMRNLVKAAALVA